MRDSLTKGRLGRLLATTLLVLVCTGCVKGLVGGEQNILRPDIIRVTVPTETMKPCVKELPDGKTVSTECPVPDNAAGKKKAEPAVSEKLLPQEIKPGSTEEMMPIPAPVPPPVEPKPPAPQGPVPQQ
jgi:hypothetical protein